MIYVLGYVPEIRDNKSAQYAIVELIYAMSEAEVRGEVPKEIQKKVQMIESSQTDGKELPILGVDELMGSVDGYGTFFEAELSGADGV